MKPTLLASLSFFALGTASWGACPAGDPAQLIQGSTWAFQTITGEAALNGSASVGTFRGLANGQLQITETVSTGGYIMRGAQHSGRYEVYADCSGGQLMFMLNRAFVQLEFVFQSNFEEMYLVSETLPEVNFLAPTRVGPKPKAIVIGRGGGGGAVLTGIAKRTPVQACPAGVVSPLEILNRTSWAFQTHSAYLAFLEMSGSASVGVLNASVVNGAGVLSAIETVSGGSPGTLTRRALESGRYIINSDCSGGELMLMNRGNPSNPVQLEFVFVGANFDEIYFLNDALPSGNGDLIAGQAKKFVTAPACPADPSTLIQGSSWAFQLRAGDFYEEGSASVGRFQVLPGGRLQVTETISNRGVINRQVQHGGSYILYADCTGGELLFDVNGRAVQLEFVYAGGTDDLYLVSDSDTSGDSVLTGVAKRTPAQACPAQPLSVISGTDWGFRTRAAYALTNSIEYDPSVGIFTPTVVAGAGVIQATETVNTSQGGLTRRAPESGRYQIYPDCSGGEILLMNRGIPSTPAQLEFVFAGPGFNQMYLLNDGVPAAGGIDVLVGEAKRF